MREHAVDAPIVQKVHKLQANEVFVFGSNEQGRHGKGAARDALKFGAVYGTGRGLQGQTYALPTKSTPYKPLPLSEIAANIRELYACAVAHPHLTFLVTPVGCGLAGYEVREIAELFTNPPDNLVFINDWNKNV